jgi:hypothetical protein
MKMNPIIVAVEMGALGLVPIHPVTRAKIMVSMSGGLN